MKELFDMPASWRVALIALLTLTVLIQTLLLLLVFARREERGLHLLKLSEMCLLLHLLMLTSLLNAVHYQLDRSAAAIGTFAALGMSSLFLAIPSALIFIRQRSVAALWTCVFLLLSLPCFGTIDGGFTTQQSLSNVFFACVAFFAIRGLVLSVKTARILRSALSRMSIKEAMDRLPAGLLFACKDGTTALVNHQMLSLARRLTGALPESADKFWNELLHFQGQTGVDRRILGEKLLLRADGRSWKFSYERVKAAGPAFTQIFAADVTETDRISLELEQLNAQLEAQGEELRTVMKNLDEIKRECEIARLQSRIHDVMGQRISILHQFLTQKDADFRNLNRLIPLLSNLVSDLRQDMRIAPDKLFTSLQESFAFIGVAISLIGTLPEDFETASLLIKVLREAATNAVRHAGAHHVTADITRQDGDLTMRIENDGTPYEGALTEGTGVTGMRRRVAEAAGTLEIIPAPRFTIIVRLPRAEAFQSRGR